jgi:hypothetical protein
MQGVPTRTSDRAGVACFHCVSLVTLKFVVRPLLAKEALEELDRAPDNGFCQLLLELLARLTGVTQRTVFRDLVDRERHTYPGRLGSIDVSSLPVPDGLIEVRNRKIAVSPHLAKTP